MTHPEHPTKENIIQQGTERKTTEFYKDFVANGGELYLQEIRRFAVGLYDSMVEQVIQSIDVSRHTPLLDLGCGVGNLEEEILNRNPQSDITCVDNTQEMINAAEDRLSESHKKPHFICHDILTLQPEKKFKAIISNLAIHNLSIEEKKRLLEKIKQWLEPNGVFIWGDFMDFEDKDKGEKVMEARKQKILQTNEVDHQFVEDILAKESQDERLTVTQTKKLLEDVGFKNIEVVWHQDFLAVLKATN